MKFKIFTIIPSLVAVLFIFQYFNNIKSLEDKNVGYKHIDKSNKPKVDFDGSKKFYNPLKTEPVTDYIREFNKSVASDLELVAGSKYYEVDTIAVKFRENTKDVIELVNEYSGNIKDYQLQVESLVQRCSSLKKVINNVKNSINNNEQNLNEIALNEYLFNQGLSESGFCKKLGTNEDPFYMYLYLARHGDELAQLLLIDNIWYATSRKLIDIKKFPKKYMELRDESVIYLQKLAARGVHRASERLAKLYSGTEILPQNLVLQYYYYSLAISQDSFENQSLNVNLEDIYRVMTDKQKQLADRMTENLKY